MTFKLFDRVKVNTSTTETGDVTFGSVVSNAFLTPTEAGCADTDTVRYVIVDGTDYEEGIGTIKSSVAAMARTTVTKSKISGTAGTTKLNLSGTAVIAFISSGADILIPVNNLADLPDADEALTNLGGTTVGKALFTATDAAAARTATGVDKLAPKGHLWGLTLSNNASDATNDIDIAAGEASDSSGNLMVLASGITKRLDASWAVGSGNGGLDTGSIANGTYHIWLIQRSDTGVVDALFSTSPSAPTMPTNYDRKRRIGSIVRASGSIRPFKHLADYFELITPVQDVSVTNLGTVKANYLMSAPIGISPILHLSLVIRNTGASVGVRAYATNSDDSVQPYSIISPAANVFAAGEVYTRVDVDGYISARSDTASTTFNATLLGWIDTRGRLN